MRFSVFPAVAVLFLAVHAHAQNSVPATPSTDRALTDAAPAPGNAAAHEHFARALDWYRTGKYHLAAQELEAALDRDPGGTDLVFNLALVQEKLGDLEGAIQSLQRFQGMEKDPAELERAAQTIERLAGARVELLAHVERAAVPVVPCLVPRQRGRFDAWVGATAGLAIASLLVGSVFAVRALTLDGETTGSAQALEGRAGRARDAALVADLAFSTTLLAGAGSTALYFGRYADAPQRAALPLRLPRISAAGLVFRY
ncbi:MAG: hypothetical protein ABI488_03090 [Polyangiaceae bacterium]